MCRALLFTADQGRTFATRTAPPVNIDQIRFGSLRDGWGFGVNRKAGFSSTGLWRTHDGGQHWRQILAAPVASLEVGRGTVWAVVNSPDGLTPTLYRGDVTSDRLTRLAGIPNRAGYVVVSGRTAFAVGVQGAGPIGSSLTVADATGIRQRSAPPCRQADFVSSDFELATSSEQRLVAVCFGQGGAGTQAKALFVSDDGGASWSRRMDPPGGGYTGSDDGGNVTAVGDTVLLSGDRSPVYRKRGSNGWEAVLTDGGSGSGFSFVGLTDVRHGVAINEQGAWTTSDGGDRWNRVRFAR